MARFRREDRIFDLREAILRQARERLEKLREKIIDSARKLLTAARKAAADTAEKAKQFNALARLRQRFALEIRDPFFKTETLKTYLIDVLVARGVTTIERVREAVAQGLGRIRQPVLGLLYELSRCVARYHSEPCFSRKYYVKLTYTTLGILRAAGGRFALYIRNFIANAKLRERLLNAIALVIHALLRSRTKSREEVYNSEMLANPGSALDDSDNADTMRSDATGTARRYSLAFLMRHPTFIARTLAWKLGMAEAASDTGHCSIYAHYASISKHKDYIDLPFQQYYDFIIHKSRERLRGIA